MEQKTLENLFRNAKTHVIVVGTNPLHPDLERSANLIGNLLVLNDNLRFTILVESDSENFGQSLLLDRPGAPQRASYATLSVHRERLLGRAKGDGLGSSIRKALGNAPQLEDALKRFSIFQVNLRLPVSIILVDERIYYCITTIVKPTLDDYVEAEPGSRLYHSLHSLAFWYCDSEDGKRFQSQPGDELIQMYDRNGVPRGIFPRACFYTTDYQRYSIWGFVFNRLGKILLHQRSGRAKDGAYLWDKSVGGHVDLRDSSTFITAERELVEEMFLPEAEFSRYIKADIGDIVHFGDWNTQKRPEAAFREEFAGLDSQDWIMFRATNGEGEPLTITRVSERRLTNKDGSITFRPTVFRSDVFFFIAPHGLVDTDEQVKALLGHAERSGAAESHRIVDVENLRDWIASENAKGKAREVFTDDLLFIDTSHRDLLDRFAEFVRFISHQQK